MKRAMISVSDPWEFFDENQGKTTLTGTIVATAPEGQWVLKLDDPAIVKGEPWSFALCLVRHSGQRYFDDPQETDRSANVIFLNEEQARLDTPSSSEAYSKLPTPFVNGTCEVIE